MSLLLLFRPASGLKFSPDAVLLPVLGSNKSGLASTSPGLSRGAQGVPFAKFGGVQIASPVAPLGKGNGLRNGLAPAAIVARIGPQGVPVAGPFAPVTYAGLSAPIVQKPGLPLLLGAYLGSKIVWLPRLVLAPDAAGVLRQDVVALSASAFGTATTTAALSTAINLAASPEGQATTTAVLTTAIHLAASSYGQANVSAALTTQEELAASVHGAATTTAALTTGIKLAAASHGQAAEAAALTTGIKLLAAIVGRATDTAALTTGIRLAAARVAQAICTANLTAGSTALQGAVVGRASTSAALSTGIKIAAASHGQAHTIATLMLNFVPVELRAQYIQLAAPTASSVITLAATATGLLLQSTAVAHLARAPVASEALSPAPSATYQLGIDA